MWSVIDAVQGGGGGNHVGGTDPTSLLVTALSQTMGVAMNDGSYWEDSISANEIRKSLQEIEPHQYQTHSAILAKGLKWLLASMSKGRDVSDFYVVVVKLVACPVLEIRKMVYIYLMQYANYSSTTRELSLLSINAFQRGLADAEAAIRALALRVLTSIQLPDILPIQLLAVTQHAVTDKAPSVRTCAALALAKLAARLTAEDEAPQRQELLRVLQQILDYETSTRVLSAALMAFTELFAGQLLHDNLYRLHSSYRKLCHLLTDMDEYGQIVALDLLTRYVRLYFTPPSSSRGIIETERPANVVDSITTLPPRPIHSTRRRRVVKKAFYSDEEDDSTDEEDEAVDVPTTGSTWRTPMDSMNATATVNDPLADEARDLDPDHELLLRSARPLLKSRNAGVVLAVCTLHFYGGGSSSHRAALGRALVRLHRSNRRQQRPEIQYVVLSSIRQLVASTAPAFAPHDFFVLPDLDPPFTRTQQLDILTALAVQDASAMRIVLQELRTYVAPSSHHARDRAFGCAAVRAVGRIAERARDVLTPDAEAPTVVLLNCLYGLMTVSQTADHELLVGEAVQVMQRLLYRLRLWEGEVHDPHRVRERAFHRIVLLLLHTLSCVVEYNEEDDEEEDDDMDAPSTAAALASTLVLPPDATASAIWLAGEYWASLSPIPGYNPSPLQRRQRSLELMRLLARAYTQLDPPEKEQAIYCATKLLVYTKSTPLPGVDPLVPLCEHVLALGRLDPIPDVRDRARMESTMIHRSPIGLQYDKEGLEEADMLAASGVAAAKLSMDDLQRIFLGRKPAASYLPFESTANDEPDAQDGNHSFRFGTLSSLVGHNARGAYMPFPPWAEVNSDPALREPPVRKPTTTNAHTFTSSDEEDESSSTSDSSTSSDESSSESSSDDEETEEEELVARPTNSMMNKPSVPERFAESESDESSSTTSSSDDEDDSEEEVAPNPSNNWNTSLIPLTSGMESKPSAVNSMGPAFTGAPSSSALDDLRGLVLSPAIQPVGVEPTDSNFDRDSGGWISLLRPEHASGLLVEGRYLRGSTKAQQAQMMGFLPEKPTVVLLQLRLENQKPTGSIRHIRILQRASATSNASVIGPRKMVLPSPIDELPAHRKTECLVGIEFMSISDRDGSLLAKLDIKFGSNGTAAIDIKPSIGDLLLPCKRSVQEFDSSVHRMQGFNRAEASFAIPPSSSRSNIPAKVLSRAALTVVHESNTASSTGTAWGPDNQIRWVGTLPSSSDPIYVVTRCVDGQPQGSIVVCCDHALVANSFVNLLKRAISE